MEFKWINEGRVKTEGNRIEIDAPAQSDFFAITEQSARKVSHRKPCVMHHFITQRSQVIL